MRRIPLGLLLTAFAIVVSAGLVAAQPRYEFRFGFKALADMIPGVVGQPTEDEHYAPNGDSLQHTTTGLMVWRKADNFTAFTDGSRTWINGPFGLQDRPNDQSFPWETPSPLPVASVQGPGGLLFGDSFTGGIPQLQWTPFPYFNLDNLKGGQDPTSPSGDKGVGVLTNDNAGGFASLSYAARDVPSDFFLESWIYMVVTPADKGQLNGLTFRVDPVEGRFFRVASNFAGDQELNLAYVGNDTNNFPLFLARWKVSDLPGGPPAVSGWHKVGIQVVANQAEVYWDGVKLPGGPFAVGRSPSGFVGTYATFTGGLGRAETRVDDFRVSGIGQ